MQNTPKYRQQNEFLVKTPQNTGNRNRAKQMGQQKTQELLHSKGNDQQSEDTSKEWESLFAKHPFD